MRATATWIGSTQLWQRAPLLQRLICALMLAISAALVTSPLLMTQATAAERITNALAVFKGLDKITGRLVSFEVAIDETVQFGALQLTPRACYTRPPTEAPNTTAFIEVDEIGAKNGAERLFTGWIFAASPGLHGIEHPIYDIWLMDCRRIISASSHSTLNHTPKIGAIDPHAPPLPPPRTMLGATDDILMDMELRFAPPEHHPLEDPLFAPIGD